MTSQPTPNSHLSCILAGSEVNVWLPTFQREAFQKVTCLRLWSPLEVCALVLTENYQQEAIPLHELPAPFWLSRSLLSTHQQHPNSSIHSRELHSNYQPTSQALLQPTTQPSNQAKNLVPTSIPPPLQANIAESNQLLNEILGLHLRTAEVERQPKATLATYIGFWDLLSSSHKK